MTEHRIGTQEERQAERDALLKEEKELTRPSPAALPRVSRSGAVRPPVGDRLALLLLLQLEHSRTRERILQVERREAHT